MSGFCNIKADLSLKTGGILSFPWLWKGRGHAQDVKVYRCEKRVIVMLESGECFCEKSGTWKKSECLGNDSQTETQSRGNVLKMGGCDF